MILDFVEKRGGRTYRTQDSDVTLVEPKEGYPYTVRPLAAKLGSTSINAVLLQPEGSENKSQLAYEFGLGANGVHYYGEAISIAELGYPVAIHDTPRLQKLEKPASICDVGHTIQSAIKHAMNPLIYPSEITHEVMNAVQNITDNDSFIVKGHSMGGPTATMLACYDNRVDALVLDSPAGITKNMVKDVAQRLKRVYSDEVIGLTEYQKEHGPADFMTKSLEHIKSDPSRLVREIAFLTLRNPDIRPGLRELQMRGVDIAIISHQYDPFFPRRVMEEEIEKLVQEGVVNHHEKVDGSRHVNPNIRPEQSAQTFDKIIRALNQKLAGQVVRTN